MKKHLFTFLFLFFVPVLQAGEVDASFLQNEWTAFVSQYPSLTPFSSQEIADLATRWGKKVATTAKVTGVREIDGGVVEKLSILLTQKHPQIFMRHGQQLPTEQVQKLPPNEQKIEMMRLPCNKEDSLTKASLVELLEGMIVWEYLQQKTKSCFVIKSSKNQRAYLVASLLGRALKVKPILNAPLDCINYPSNDKMTTAELLRQLPDGTLPWEKEKVDAVIGAGTYDRITQDMKRLLCSCTNANTVLLAITHTQQMNAVALLSDLPVSRLGNFGFIFLTKASKEVFAEGIYKKPSAN